MPDLQGLQAANRALEQGIRALREELARRTEERDQANADTRQLVYAASHDLREACRMISSRAQLLARRYQGKLDADVSEFIAYAQGGAARIQELIDDVLAYSRVADAACRLLEKVDCELVLIWVLSNLEGPLRDSGAVVTHDPLPCVVADESQIARLLQELIKNALKFRSGEPPVIHLAARRAEQEWVFTVRDNGAGIDPRCVREIFGVFKRLHGRECSGSGVGLAVARKIVEHHGGRIWVESEPGDGSAFHFTIPT